MTKKKICRLIGIVAVFIWAGILLYFYASGRIGDGAYGGYIRPQYLRDLSFLGGLGLLVLGIFNLVFLNRPDTHFHDHDHGHAHDDCDECEHDHEDNTIFGNSAMFAVMVVPVLLALFYTEDSFTSAETIKRRGFEEDPNAVASKMNEDFIPSKKREKVQKALEDAAMVGVTDGSGNPVPEENTTPQDEWEYTLEDLEKVVDRSAEGNLQLTVDQLFYTTGDEELQHVLDGQPVETVGQIIPEDGYNPDGKRLRLFTLMITCCAADAQPISLPVEFPEGTPEYEEMSWVKVSGTMIYPMENGRKQAVMKVKAMEPTQEPVDYFMF